MKRFSQFFVRVGIYRDVKAGWITGVCAGIAERLSIKPIWVRLVVVIVSVAAHCIVPLIVYLLSAFFIKPRGETGQASPAGVQMAYRDLADSVTPTLASGRRVAELKTRFATLEARLNNLEAEVMSDRLSLRRKFRDIGG
jgi:phage shock protein C